MFVSRKKDEEGPEAAAAAAAQTPGRKKDRKFKLAPGPREAKLTRSLTPDGFFYIPALARVPI